MGGTSFSEWLSERNLLVLALSVLFIAAVERLATRVHEQVLVPTFEHCARRAGLAPHPGEPPPPHHERVLLHILEFVFIVLVVYAAWRLLVPRNAAPAASPWSPEGRKTATAATVATPPSAPPPPAFRAFPF